MDNGMATKKITITLEVEQYDAIRSLVDARTTKSVSAFVQHAVGVSLSDVAGWGALLAEALEQTGGPLTKAERHWADGVLSARSDKSAKRRASTKGRAA
jgi:Arc/MetJ-type ribon-helix-helix transcriptional regulator